MLPPDEGGRRFMDIYRIVLNSSSEGNLSGFQQLILYRGFWQMGMVIDIEWQENAVPGVLVK
jgi:hypothetical protein